MERFAHDVYRVTVSTPGWARHSQAELTPPPRAQSGRTSLDAQRGFGLRLLDCSGGVALESLPGRAFGVCGPASLFAFRRQPGWRFYGLGEKTRGHPDPGATAIALMFEGFCQGLGEPKGETDNA